MAPKAKTTHSTSSSERTPKDVILFCNPKKEWGVFSTWYTEVDGHFKVDEQLYHNVEQFMQAGKARLFEDDWKLQEILESASPKEVKQLGSNVTAFEESVWESAWPDLLVTATRAKFSQNERLCNILLSTENCTIGYAAPKSGSWGIGMGIGDAEAFNTSKWSQNRIGTALMQVRDVLSKGEHTTKVSTESKPVHSSKLAARIKKLGSESDRGPVCVCVNGLEGPVFGPAEVAGSTTVSSLIAQILAITKLADRRRPKLVHETGMLSDAETLPKAPDGDQLTLSIVYLSPLQYDDFSVESFWDHKHGQPASVIRYKHTMNELHLRGSSIYNSWGKTVNYKDVQVLEADDGIVVEYTRIDGFDDPDQEEMGMDDEQYAAFTAAHQPRHTKYRYQLDVVENRGLVWGPQQKALDAS